MKVLLYCMVIAILQIYSIETKGRRSKSCKEWKEICIKKQLHHFEKRYKSKTVCLEKHEPVFHSNGSLLKEYYTIANRKSCGSKGVVQVARKCVKYAKENQREGLLHLLVNKTCWSSAFLSYQKKRLKLTIKANVVCSSQKRIRHTKCGKFRHGDVRNSTTEDDRMSTLVSISTPNYTIIESLVPNSTTTTSWIDLDYWNHLNTNISYLNYDVDKEEVGSLSYINISILIVSIVIVIVIVIVICKRTLLTKRGQRKGRISRLTCLKSREEDNNCPDVEMNTSVKMSLKSGVLSPLLIGEPKICISTSERLDLYSEPTAHMQYVQSYYKGIGLLNSNCNEENKDLDLQTIGAEGDMNTFLLPAYTGNGLRGDLLDSLMSTKDNTAVDNGSIITSMPHDKYASDLEDSFDDLYSGTDCEVWLNEIPDLTVSDDQNTRFVSSLQTNIKTINEHEPRDVSDDSSLSNEDNTAIKSVDTGGRSNPMPLEKHTSNSTNSIPSTLFSELNRLDEMNNKESVTTFAPSITSLTHTNRNHDYFENLPRSHEPNKLKRLSMPTDLICLLYSLRKANSEPDLLRTSLTDVRHLRRSYGKRTDFFEGFQSRNGTKECVEIHYSSFDSGDNDIQSCTVTDKRASLHSSGSTISTHIRLGDTSHLFTEEGRENGQTQAEEEEEANQESDQPRIDNDQDAEEEEEDIEDEMEEYENMVEGVEVNSQQNKEEEEDKVEVEGGEEDYNDQEEENEDHDGGIRTYNNYKTVRSKHKTTITAIKNNLSESVKTAMGKSLSLDKESNQSDQNDFRSYYQDGGTQTKSQNLPRTIFNTDWTAEASFGIRGGELQTENSSVKLIVTPDTVKESESITISAHVHVHIKKLAEVLEIPKNEFIVSPAPEYHLNADWKRVIKKPMIIQLPVTLPPTFITENLRVYVFQSKAVQVVKYPIGEKSKQNDNGEDSYFDVSEDRKNILIYTYHFSGVVACYRCSKDVLVPGFLNARILGSNKPGKHGRDVQIRYEIFAENEIKDFEAQIHPVHNGLVPIEKKVRIILPAKVGNDSKMIIKLVVVGDESNLWQCKKYPYGEEIYPLEKEVCIKELIICSAHIDTFYTDFVMCGTPESTDEPLQPFECVISVYEKDADGTEGAVAISSSNKSYVKLSDQLGIQAAYGSMGEVFQANKSRDEKRTANNPEQVVYVAQESQAMTQPIAQPHTDSLEIRSNNRSMAELNNREVFRRGMQEVGLPPGISRQASHQRDVGEVTDGPKAMAELYINETDQRSPCENSDINEYPAHPDPDQDQTVPKDTDKPSAATMLSFDK